MDAYTFVQNLCTHTIHCPEKKIIQTSQDNSMTESNVVLFQGAGTCFMLGERRIKRASQAHPINSVWYCWLKPKTVYEYSDLKNVWFFY